MFLLTGKVALVTGAGKGIGKAIALGFAEAGADVVCAARTRKEIEETASEIEARGQRALAVVTDVTHSEQLVNLVTQTMQAFGRLDILVNNAGGTGPRSALETSTGYFRRSFEFNVLSAFELTQLAVPKMVETAGAGTIINISSRASDMVQTAFVAYGSSKAALNMMTRNMAMEFAPKVRVNALSVGGVATESLEVVLNDDNLRDMFMRNTPMRRAGEPEDIAAAALFLASPASSWVTGKVIQIDGGTESPSIAVPVTPL
ncbi:MAG: glucose 1-dehydrogenase [Proteobacteria bacterium]|nr:glucose 1-dehydrogenase [Pseudomonadota bacterium]